MLNLRRLTARKAYVAKRCTYSKCKSPAVKYYGKEYYRKYCNLHLRYSTINAFLFQTYYKMKRRVNGFDTKRPDLYLGKPLMPKDVFLTWSKNHNGFLKLYKRWVSEGFNRKLKPTVNRLNSGFGYTLDNVEWITVSQNCSLAGSERSRKAKREIYNLLGVNNV